MKKHVLICRGTRTHIHGQFNAACGPSKNEGRALPRLPHSPLTNRALAVYRCCKRPPQSSSPHPACAKKKLGKNAKKMQKKNAKSKTSETEILREPNSFK